MAELITIIAARFKLYVDAERTAESKRLAGRAFPTECSRLSDKWNSLVTDDLVLM